MTNIYQKRMDEMYGVQLHEEDGVASRHFGYFPPGETLTDLPKAQDRYIQEVSKYIKKGSYVLDLGCAFGETSIWLAQNLDCKVLGIDLVEVQIEQANQFAKKSGLEDRLKFMTLDACNMEFEEGTFDYIISLGVLVHVPQKEKVLKNAFRALKPGGGIAFSDPIIGENCPWFTRKMVYWITNNVTFVKQVREYYQLLEKVGFEDVQDQDVTETSFIQTLKLSKEEKYKTMLAPFRGKGYRYLWLNSFFCDIYVRFAIPALQKRNWGWHFFWAQKKTCS